MNTTLSEKWKYKKSFDNYCTCGGYAHTMNNRNVEQPHMNWCPQFEEYAEYRKYLEVKNQSS